MVFRRNSPLLYITQVALLAGFLLFWHIGSVTDFMPEFFFGEPIKVFTVVWSWLESGYIYPHLLTTLTETLLAFVIGTFSGLVFGMWFGLSPTAAALFDPYLKSFNAMPRVILAPIFTVWFGLTIWSKVALGVTLVFFVVFFNVFQGVRDANPVVLNSTRMLGASNRQLIRYFYLPSAMNWVFSSLHAAVGMAFVGAVVGEYIGSARGVGYVILQAESVFDINAVFAGLVVLTLFALLLDLLVTFIERRMMVWRPV